MTHAPTGERHRTGLYDRHVALGAKIIDFAGWEMPVRYPTGAVAEHLATRKGAGLFDVSHMGRFVVRGPGALGLLQHALTNNAAALDEGAAQYTMIPTPTGGAVDDAYLYHTTGEDYLLVVNAANRQKDWRHLNSLLAASSFGRVDLTDITFDRVMLSLQGPDSQRILQDLITDGPLPEPTRNTMSDVRIGDASVTLSRTGYTGEPLCFELFLPAADGPALWDALTAAGAAPVGLGARDTLRLEAGLPLYGHELGADADGNEIPIMACPPGRLAVSFAELKGDFVGRAALQHQREALAGFLDSDFSKIADLPRRIRPVAILGRGVARQGAAITKDGRPVGIVTSGTMAPFGRIEGEGSACRLADDHRLRAIALAYLDSDTLEGDRIEIDVRGKTVPAVVVPHHLRGERPYARPVVVDGLDPGQTR